MNIYKRHLETIHLHITFRVVPKLASVRPLIVVSQTYVPLSPDVTLGLVRVALVSPFIATVSFFQANVATPLLVGVQVKVTDVPTLTSPEGFIWTVGTKRNHCKKVHI